MLVVVGRAVAAQETRALTVRVIDSVSHAAVPGAEVRVRARRDSTVRRSARTDSAGRALVYAAVDEQMLIIVRRLGFATRTMHMPVRQDLDSVVVALVPTAVTLDPSVTHAAAAVRQLALAGFYERRQRGFGTFLDSAAVADRQPFDLLSVLKPYLKGCTMIYVDGLRMLGLRDVDVREVIGIEIYRSNTEAPEEFRNPAESAQRCGSIVIWRRI